ncbi:B12-binding domain-containing radical SAM protein [Streptomyces eurythermus]|uniref:B12-binding domain-containing radical SAM protein n=1 Tax=Streptomyces eurythermus TaxID=42237 RepID=UPI003402A66B
MTPSPAPLSLTPVVRTAPAATVAVVSLPFFTPFATCYPAVLITRRLRQLGCRARFLPAHMEFYAFARGRGLPESAYKLFTIRHFASDVALLPLWSPPAPAHRAERAELSRTEILAGAEDETRLRELFDAYLDRLAERLVGTEVLCLTSTHFQLLPSLLLARRAARAARARGVPRPRVVLGGYFGSSQVARDVLDRHEEVDVVVYGEAEDVLGDAVHHALQGRRRLVAGRAHTFKDGYAEQSALVAAGTRRPWLRDRLVVSLELSRGCYWDRCDFCNFNDAYDARFKMHDPARVLAEMAHLARTYGQRRFQFLDTALPPRLTQALDASGTRHDYRVFCEIRPDFGRERLRQLARLGRVTVQLGIETLLEDHLALMDKRQSVEEGVRMLRAARSLGMRSVWGVMIGHPKETPDHRRRLLAEIRAHRRAGLPSPKYLTECELRPGSGLWDERAALGLSVEFPWRMFDSLLSPREHACSLIPSRVRGMPFEEPGYRADRRAISEELTAWQREQGMEAGLDA